MDPLLYSSIIEYLVKSIPSWLSATGRTFGNGLVASNISIPGIKDKRHIRQLQLALSNAIVRGLNKFNTLAERDQYRDILELLAERHSEILTTEAIKLFSIADDPDLALLTETFNRSKRLKALSQNIYYQDVDAKPYLVSFFNALIDELYRTPLFREQLSDVIKIRAALYSPHLVTQTVHHVERQEVFMGDKVEGNKPTYSIGDITNSTVSGLVQGENNTVISNLNASGKTELAETLKALTDAVMASKDLPADQKEDQVKIINQIGEEAAKPKPNKSLLRILGDGLLTTLKVIPDVATTVAAAAPVLTQLHL